MKIMYWDPLTPARRCPLVAFLPFLVDVFFDWQRLIWARSRHRLGRLRLLLLNHEHIDYQGGLSIIIGIVFCDDLVEV